MSGDHCGIDDGSITGHGGQQVWGARTGPKLSVQVGASNEVEKVDMDPVRPSHYKGVEIALAYCDTYGVTTSWIRNTFERGGKRWLSLSCLDVMRHFKDPRLADAFKYIWRVGLGGGKVGAPKDQDIRKAIVYLQDYLDNPVD